MPWPGFWQIKMDEVLKQCTAFTVGNLGFFGCDCMPCGLSNAPATLQSPRQNCLWELNLIYCLIYLDDIIIFSQMAEEHLYHLHIIFDQLREHNLKWNLSKCDFYRNEITYLAHQVSKDILPQKLKPEGNYRMHPTENLHQSMRFCWPGGPLQEVH